MNDGVREDAAMRVSPLHPGGAIHALYMKSADDRADNISYVEAAARLGVSRVTLSRIVNGHAGITTDVALKLEAVGWGTADGWLQMQINYNLAEARKQRQQPKPRVEDMLSQLESTAA